MSSGLLRTSIRAWIVQKSCLQAPFPSSISLATINGARRVNHSLYLLTHRQNASSSSWTTKSLPQSTSQRSTIYALSTPPGRGGIGVVRVSGPDARVVWEHMLVTPKRARPITVPLSDASRQLYRCRVVHPTSKEPIDDGMAVFFHGKCLSCNPSWNEQSQSSNH